jgi:ubiquinone/menaquinone biosynthesis C-methylase UbiE
MSDDGLASARTFYDQAYLAQGFAAQRLYPNEELLRFMGSWYFRTPRPERRNIRVLEIGCGSGANLWMIAREGFEAHGLDISAVSLDLCREMLTHWGTSATLACSSMTEIAYPDATFDAVVDVFSSYCLDEKDFAICLDEVTRVLKPGGRFFTYAPSKGSDAFKDPGPSHMLDASTLDGMHRETAPFYGQAYPFRFIAVDEIERDLARRGMATVRNELIGRTYRGRQEYFEFISLHAQKEG